MFKIIKITFCLLIFTNVCISQNINNIKLTEDNQRMFSETGIIRCLTVEIDRLNKQKFQNRETSEDFEQWLAPLVNQYKLQVTNGYQQPILTIPVIFHIITDGAGAENLTAAQVQAQVDQLNIDFRNLAGSSNAVAADLEIEFCLATLDPSDNIMPEPGINRITTYGDGPFFTAFVDGTIKPGTSWNPNDYMNVWVADISGGILGYAQRPDGSGLAGMGAVGGAANTDGAVFSYKTIGSVDNPNPNGGSYSLGRTVTHEVGHWMGLLHIWGNGGCGIDDFCGDTPVSDASNFGCPNHTSCGTRDMIENYMDYTNDACMDIFTEDQKARVRTVMTVSPRRSTLPSSTKCGVPSPIIGFVNGGGTIINEGTDCGFQDVLLDLNISMAPSAAAVVTFTSAGTANNGTDYDITPASVTFPAGATPTRQVRVRIYNDGLVEGIENLMITFNVATTGDAIPATGDLLDHDITINDNDVVPALGVTVTLLSQDFEAGLATFTTEGFAGSDRFLVASATGASSDYWTIANSNTTQFAYSNDDNCNCNKSNDRLISPIFSLAGAYITAGLTFDHAFADMQPEIAEVQVSTTGGGYITIGTLTNTSAVDGNGVVTTPWVNGNSIDLTPYIGQATVQVRFRYRDSNDWLYGLAIDNIVVTAEAPNSIQVTDNTASPQNIPIRGMDTVHYYDLGSGAVMGTIQNLSAWDYQCTQVEVDRDATSASGSTAPFWDNNPANAITTKTFFVEPLNKTPTGSSTITLFYTETEIAAWEAATGNSRNDLFLYKVANDRISNVNPSNYNSFTIEQQPATVGSFGTGLTFEATFNSGIHGGYALGIQQPTLNNDEFNADLFKIYPNPSNGYVSLFINSNYNVNVNLYDIRGREIFTKTYKNHGAFFSIDIDFKKYASGMYLLSVKSGSKTKTKKLIFN